MRFKVAKRDLEAALQVVGSTIANSGSDISSHFTFRRTGDETKYGVDVLTYSGQTCSSCPLPAVTFDDVGTKKKTAFTVEGWRLKDWLKCVPADSVPEFQLSDGELVIRVKRGSQDFQSLDPSTFPYWDKVLSEAKVTATIPADRLAGALAYARLFIMDKDTSEPDKSVCEVKEGVLYSSDKKAVSLVQVSGLGSAGFRVHGKDIGPLLTFLGAAGDGNVEVLEHDRNLFVRRMLDGAVFGEAKFQYSFPVPKIRMDDVSHHTWDIPCDELKQAIGFLVAGADPQDNRLRFEPGETGDSISVSMTNSTGKVTALPITGVKMTSEADAVPVPEEGFMLDHNVLSRILNTWKEPNIQLGVTYSGSRGLIRCRYEKLDSVYLTILATLR